MSGVHVVLPVSGRIGRPTRSDAIVGAPGREIMLNDAVSISFDLYQHSGEEIEIFGSDRTMMNIDFCSFRLRHSLDAGQLMYAGYRCWSLILFYRPIESLLF